VFYTYAGQDAMMLPAGWPPVKGREEIRKVMSEGPGGELKWTRQQACISEAGDLGYPWGRRGNTGRNGSAASRCKLTIWGRMRFSLPTGANWDSPCTGGRMNETIENTAD
jgi:ketosteroid isomerase-like protein